MDINKTNMQALFTDYLKSFKDAYATRPTEYQMFTMNEGINATRLELPFLLAFAGMREWLGPRKVKDFESEKVIYTEKSFEETVGVPVRSIETDGFGLYSTIVAQMADAAADQRGINALEALSTNDAWIDGVNFFSAAGRSYGSNVISNYGTGALSATTFDAAYLAMSTYKGDNDKLLNSKPNVLMVGPANRTTAWNIIKNEFAYDATAKVQIKNVNQNLVDLVVNPMISGTTWFLLNTTSRIKPVFQNVPKAATLVSKTRIDDNNVFDEDKFLYGTTLRTATGKTFPHLAYMGTGA